MVEIVYYIPFKILFEERLMRDRHTNNFNN